jgi:ribonucleoside-diphosphate reductase alpha chain
MSSIDVASPVLVRRFFTDPSTSPFDTVEWETRDAWPSASKYHNPGILVPKFWSQQALDITSKLYLAKAEAYEEKSIRQLIERVVSQYAIQAILNDYFMPYCIPVEYMGMLDAPGVRLRALEIIREKCSRNLTDPAPIIFYDELCYILLHQLAAFNSPVWFNVGRPDRPQQISACYILSVGDDTTSIMETAQREAFIFKGGSGSGFSVSDIRGSDEPLSTGGTASGPVSFMRLWDASAGTFKSGGTTRRAAKLANCTVDHPDIVEFIECKAREEERLRVLAAAGVNIGFDEEGERNVAEATSFQNANNSVGVTHEFMRKVVGEDPDDLFMLRDRSRPRERPMSALELMDKIVSAAWACADPGLQFMDTINSMHTTPVLDGVSSPIRSTNPCGEYMSNDDTSCNLASMNVLKFLRPCQAGDRAEPGFSMFAIDDYRHTVQTMILAMDVGISFSSSPDEVITERTKKLRQLGLGYSNMGAAIMAQGWSYDSSEARDFATSVTALTTGVAYEMSAILAEAKEPFHYYDENSRWMHDVIERHVEALPSNVSEVDTPIWVCAVDAWRAAGERGVDHGFRNAQVTVIAPAGSISYLMDCDTTGIEPAFQLVSYKELAGGESMTIVNQSVRRALSVLGYDAIDETVEAIGRGDMSSISEEDRAVFAGANDISVDGHLRMLAAVQPFVSGGISKTINMPEQATVADVRNAYVQAWRLGLKGISIYRDGSKARQVLAAVPKVEVESAVEEASQTLLEPFFSERLDTRQEAPPSRRKRLPRRRRSVTHKIQVQGQLGEHEGYVTIGFYEDGRIGEMFLEGFGRMGGFTQNALAQWATDFSIALQYGVPLGVLLTKHVGQADETGGMVAPDPDGNPLVARSCDSIIDYVVKLVASESGDVDLQEELGVMTKAVKARKMGLDLGSGGDTSAPHRMHSTNGHARSVVMGPTCTQCGKTMHRAGSCWQCPCGNSSGGCG